ncbi:unnamed protein product [Acanthoscelides obtectus]|uniref:Uncharacterized protein n=1 Tax=Acanthoscelides obtectus TaxID=200917 RepID=A0A9P0KHR8_ACAOB|nr:unnamed protein product [Acanthoscelides obtectus]CAK1627676.1 hypothetical protein AOBTE_LOCUS4761 [Acanthoscelides obtectus]
MQGLSRWSIQRKWVNLGMKDVFPNKEND